MKTIQCTFLSNGENIKKTAIVKDSLTELSKSKNNEATDIIDDFIQEDEIWILFFDMSETAGYNLGYEVQFKVDREGNKTLKPVKAVTWESDIITDEQNVKVTVKQ